MSAPPPGDGPPPAEPPHPAAPSPPAEGPPPTEVPHQPAPSAPSVDGPPPADAPHQPSPSTPPGDGHLPPAEEPQPAAAVPSAEDHTPPVEAAQPVAAVPPGVGHPALDGEHLPTSRSPAPGLVPAGTQSAELAEKAAHAPQPEAAVPPGRPSSLSDTGRSLAHNVEPRGGRPANPLTARPHGDATVDHSPKTGIPSGAGDGHGPHSTEPGDGGHGDGGHGDREGGHRGNGHRDGGHAGDGHGSHGDGAGKPPHDPVHSHEPSGDGWERLPDEPRHPHYGEPLDHHWQYPHDPTDPNRINPDVAKLIKDPHAPFGRDPHGHAYTPHEYEDRFNKVGPQGQRWYNFASADGALEGTKVAFNSLEQYKKFFGHLLDRIGDEKGGYLAVMENGKPAPWEHRSLHVDSMAKPLHAYTIDELPKGWKIEVSEIEPAVGQPGGAVQVRILDETGKVIPVEELRRIGVLR